MKCSETFCSQCLTTTHAAQPLHSFALISDAGTLYPTTAADLGLTLDLGHSGALCPNAVYHQSVLLDITQSELESQTIHVNFCHCSGAQSHEDQLVAAGFFPDAADSEPEHCFTLECAVWIESLNRGER
jgi:hypothetical protein